MSEKTDKYVVEFEQRDTGLSDKLKELELALGQLKVAQEEASKATEEGAEAQEEAAESTEKAQTRIQKLKDRVKELSKETKESAKELYGKLKGGLAVVATGALAAGAATLAAGVALTKWGASAKDLRKVEKAFSRVNDGIQGAVVKSGAFRKITQDSTKVLNKFSDFLDDNSVAIQNYSVDAVIGFYKVGQELLNLGTYGSTGILKVQQAVATLQFVSTHVKAELTENLIEFTRTMKGYNSGLTESILLGYAAIQDMPLNPLGQFTKRYVFNLKEIANATVQGTEAQDDLIKSHRDRADAAEGVFKAQWDKIKAEDEARQKSLAEGKKALADSINDLEKSRSKIKKRKSRGKSTDEEIAAGLERAALLDRQRDIVFDLNQLGEDGYDYNLALRDLDRQRADILRQKMTPLAREVALKELELQQATLVKDRELELKTIALDRVAASQKLALGRGPEADHARALIDLERQRQEVLNTINNEEAKQVALDDLELQKREAIAAYEETSSLNAMRLNFLKEKGRLGDSPEAEHRRAMLDLEQARQELLLTTMSAEERQLGLLDLEVQKRAAITAEAQRLKEVQAEQVQATLDAGESLSGGIISLTDTLRDNDIARLTSLKEQADAAASAEGATQAQRDAAVQAGKDVEAAERRKEKAARRAAIVQGLLETARASAAIAQGIMGNPAAFVAAGSHALAAAQFFATAGSGGGASSSGGGASAEGGASTGSTSTEKVDLKQIQADAAKATAEAIVEANQRQAEGRSIVINLTGNTLLGESPEMVEQLGELLADSVNRRIREGRR